MLEYGAEGDSRSKVVVSGRISLLWLISTELLSTGSLTVEDDERVGGRSVDGFGELVNLERVAALGEDVKLGDMPDLGEDWGSGVVAQGKGEEDMNLEPPCTLSLLSGASSAMSTLRARSPTGVPLWVPQEGVR